MPATCAAPRRNIDVAKIVRPRTVRGLMRSTLALAFVGLAWCCLDASLVEAGKAKKLKNNLMSVPEPHPGRPANAHPFVNAIVLFGQLSDGTPADPATFRAKLGREDITSKFSPTYNDQGVQTGA